MLNFVNVTRDVYLITNKFTLKNLTIMRKFYLFSLLLSMAIVACQTAYAQQSNAQTIDSAISSVQNSVSNGYNIPDYTKPKFNAYIYAGMVADFNRPNLSKDMFGPKLDVSLGSRINKYIYIGGNIGSSIPIYGYSHKRNRDITRNNGLPEGLARFWYNAFFHWSANLKVFIPTKSSKVTPFFDVNLGWNYEYEADYGGAYMSYGAGVDISRFSIILGYEGLWTRDLIADEYKSFMSNLFLIKLGVRLGK